jgi:hypothetical protein
MVWGWPFDQAKLLDGCAAKPRETGEWQKEFLVVEQQPKAVL